MSGTPVLSTIQEGLAGAQVLTLRGILNGTANYVLTRMAEGLEYHAALADAQARDYAEPDPSDDLEGHDVVAKARILAAVAFGRTVPLDQVVRRGITGITANDIHQAAQEGCRLKLVASVRPKLHGEGATFPSAPLEIRVEPSAVPLTDPLSRVDGVMNALNVETDTVRDVTIVGPGAGPEQAGQGAFADLMGILRSTGTGPRPGEDGGCNGRDNETLGNVGCTASNAPASVGRSYAPSAGACRSVQTSGQAMLCPRARPPPGKGPCKHVSTRAPPRAA